jgi:DNA-binding NarL/FixJ family response regulator
VTNTTLLERDAELRRMVAGGAANAEIAARLLLSVRTADHHVSAVLQKLGVTRRNKTATTATALGVDPERSRGERVGRP